MYSAAWHHVHLYAPRSISPDSNMPAYRFLYEKRRIAGQRSAEALQLSGGDAPPDGWEVVPTYDAKCVVAYLMGLNQSHPLKEVRSVGGARLPGRLPRQQPRVLHLLLLQRRCLLLLNDDAMNDEPKMPLRTGQGMDYGEQADVQQVHAAVQREKREPRVGAEPLSIWLIAIYGLAIFFGGAYLGRYSGNFMSGGLDPMGSPPAPKKAVAGGPGGGEQAELSPRDRGKKVFSSNCQTCHQANGLGVAGQYPPLAGSEFTTGGSRRMA
jgi:hypothetical protein